MALGELSQNLRSIDRLGSRQQGVFVLSKQCALANAHVPPLTVSGRSCSVIGRVYPTVLVQTVYVLITQTVSRRHSVRVRPGSPDGTFLRIGSLLETTRRSKACDRDSSGHRVG